MDADDTVPFCAGSNSKVIQDNLNQGLNTFGEWLKVNSLFLNTTKTEAMLFGTNSKLSKHKDFDLTFHGQSLKRVNMFTYLGIIFDETISWAPYIQYILPKVGKRLGLLSRLQRDLTCHAANTLYLSLIHTVWNCCGVGNARLLDNFQRRASKIVSRSMDSDKALMDLTWLELQSREDKHTFKLVNKCISGNCPQFFKEIFQF